MLEIQVFTFNPFMENTYLVFDESKECLIIDPGMLEKREEQELVDFIDSRGLKPVRLLNTHCHIDHIWGNRFVHEHYQLPLEAPEEELFNLTDTKRWTEQLGVPEPNSPLPKTYLKGGDVIKFGNEQALEALFTPGHSPGHLSFYHETSKIVIAGDALFQGSIGRTDLPGGDFDTLIQSIKEKLFVLDNDVKVYPGHGPYTTIGFEKDQNPFFAR